MLEKQLNCLLATGTDRQVPDDVSWRQFFSDLGVEHLTFEGGGMVEGFASS